MSGDGIDEAIRKVEQPTAIMANLAGNLPSGKPYKLAVTPDADDFDFLCLHNVVNSLRDQIVAARKQQQERGRRIALPDGSSIPVPKLD